MKMEMWNVSWISQDRETLNSVAVSTAIATSNALEMCSTLGYPRDIVQKPRRSFLHGNQHDLKGVGFVRRKQKDLKNSITRVLL